MIVQIPRCCLPSVSGCASSGVRVISPSPFTEPIRELSIALARRLSNSMRGSLQEFVIDGSQNGSWAMAKKRTTALRMFLRFLSAEGKCTAGLEAAIPVLAHWLLPRCPDTCNQTMWSVSSPHVIPHHQLAAAIGLSCCSSHAWGSGRAISFCFGCRTFDWKGG